MTADVMHPPVAPLLRHRTHPLLISPLRWGCALALIHWRETAMYIYAFG